MPELTVGEARRLLPELTVAALAGGTVIGAVCCSGILADRCDCENNRASQNLSDHTYPCSATKWYLHWCFVDPADGRRAGAVTVMESIARCQEIIRTQPCPA